MNIIIKILAVVIILLMAIWALKNGDIASVDKQLDGEPDQTSDFVSSVDSVSAGEVRVLSLKAGEVIESPLVIKGEAPGTWFFEASFPIQLMDSNGQVIATAIAQAKGDWMTTDYVPFEATLTFDGSLSGSGEGELVFKKDNPSGLPENDGEFRMPVRF